MDGGSWLGLVFQNVLHPDFSPFLSESFPPAQDSARGFTHDHPHPHPATPHQLFSPSGVLSLTEIRKFHENLKPKTAFSLPTPTHPQNREGSRRGTPPAPALLHCNHPQEGSSAPDADTAGHGQQPLPFMEGGFYFFLGLSSVISFSLPLRLLYPHPQEREGSEKELPPSPHSQSLPCLFLVLFS